MGKRRECLGELYELCNNSSYNSSNYAESTVFRKIYGISIEKCDLIDFDDESIAKKMIQKFIENQISDRKNSELPFHIHNPFEEILIQKCTEHFTYSPNDSLSGVYHWNTFFSILQK